MRQDVQDGEYDYSHLGAEHGPKKVLILGTSFAHIRAAMWTKVEGLSQWEANNHRELEVRPLVTLLLMAQSPTTVPKESCRERRRKISPLWKLDLRCSQ